MTGPKPRRMEQMPQDQQDAAGAIVTVIDRIVRAAFVMKQDFSAEPRWVLTIGFDGLEGQSTLSSENIKDRRVFENMLKNALIQLEIAHGKDD